MICLPDAMRRLKDPTAPPCAPCVIESLRNPVGEALAKLAGDFRAEMDAAPDPDLSKLAVSRGKRPMADGMCKRSARNAAQRAWRARRAAERRWRI